MNNPFKRGEYIPDGGKGGCDGLARSILVVVVVTLSALGYAAYQGVSGFVAWVS